MHKSSKLLIAGLAALGLLAAGPSLANGLKGTKVATDTSALMHKISLSVDGKARKIARVKNGVSLVSIKGALMAQQKSAFMLTGTGTTAAPTAPSAPKPPATDDGKGKTKPNPAAPPPAPVAPAARH